MDNKIQSVHYKKHLFSETKEHQLETQLNLPDYYPDICRILSCKVTTYLEKCFVDADRINADGIAVIRLLYCSDDKTMHLFETEHRFAKSIALQRSVRNPILNCNYQTESVRYRAVGPRRIDVRTCIKLSADVSVVAEVGCCDSEQTGVELLQKSYELFDISARCNEMFVINEDFTVRDERIKDSKVLDSAASICTTEIKCVRDKILIKGNAELNILYLFPKDMVMFKYSEAVPFSQIIDLYGVKETDKIFVCLKAMQPVLSFKDSGECELSLCVSADITAGEAVSATIIEDAFGCDCKLNMNQEKESLHKNIRSFKDSFSSYSESEKTEYKELQILSSYAEPPLFNADIQQEKLSVDGKINVCILALSEDGIVSINRSVQFDYVREVECCDVAEVNFDVSCVSVTCNDSASGIQLKTELELTGYCYLNDRISYVASYDVEALEQSCEFDTVTLYFADCGERLWDIAKQNRVSLQAIKANNDITGDFVEENKVLILLRSEADI